MAHASVEKPGYLHARAYTRLRARARARTHTQKYVILIVFPQQQCFRKLDSIFRYTDIACLVYSEFRQLLRTDNKIN